MTTTVDLLRQAAIRAAERPFYLASVLWPAARLQSDPWAWIAREAGVSEDDAANLLLCANPESDYQLDQIVDRFGAAGLAGLLDWKRAKS